MLTSEIKAMKEKQKHQTNQSEDRT
jgi:hypothetical protein